MFKTIVAAACGGILPTVCRLAAAFTADPKTPWPAAGLYVGVALFAVAGMIVAFCFKETDLRKALCLGIAAPGIVTSVISGATQPRSAAIMPTAPAPVASSSNSSWHAYRLLGISDALAAEASAVGASPTSRPGARLAVIAISGESLATGIASLLDSSGRTLASQPVAAGTATMYAPPNATQLRLSTANSSQVIMLPESFSQVAVSATMQAAKGSDFLWALGAPRTSKVNVSALKIDRVVSPSLPKAVSTIAVGTPITKGSKSVGVVRTVETDAHGNITSIGVR